MYTLKETVSSKS